MIQTIKKWIYQLAIKIIAKRIVWSKIKLTPAYLQDNGWIREELSWVEPNIKKRDKIWIEFEAHYYRVWHGRNKTFIALESSAEWFELYYLLHSSSRRYDLSGI